MATSTVDTRLEAREFPRSSDYPFGKWTAWPVYWNGIIVGTLAALAVATIFGLVSIAVGAQLSDPDYRLTSLKSIRFQALLFAIFGSFFSFVAGGWVASKIAGIRHSEPAMLHGGIVWALAVPCILLMTAIGASGYSGGWYSSAILPTGGAYSAKAPFERPEPIASTASSSERTRYQTEVLHYQEQVQQWREQTPNVVRNNAICAITALLLGLIGSVIGGWMASGEPMTLTYRRDLDQVSARA